MRQIQARELRESRPVVKSPNESVLRPGTAARQMSVTRATQPRLPGAEVQPQGLHPRSVGRETQRPSGISREVQRPSGTREMQQAPSAAPKREMQRSGGGTGGRAVQESSQPPKKEVQKPAPEAPKERGEQKKSEESEKPRGHGGGR